MALLALLAAGCAWQPAGLARASQRAAPPPELTASAWGRTPQMVVANPRPNERLVWAGSVERFTYRQVGEETEFEWVFRQLAFRGPAPAAVTSRPVPVERSGDGYFVVRLRERQAEDKARRVSDDLETHHPQYALAGGTFDSVVELDGKSMVLLTDPSLETGPEMVAFPR